MLAWPPACFAEGSKLIMLLTCPPTLGKAISLSTSGSRNAIPNSLGWKWRPIFLSSTSLPSFPCPNCLLWEGIGGNWVWGQLWYWNCPETQAPSPLSLHSLLWAFCRLLNCLPWTWEAPQTLMSRSSSFLTRRRNMRPKSIGRH